MEIRTLVAKGFGIPGKGFGCFTRCYDMQYMLYFRWYP